MSGTHRDLIFWSRSRSFAYRNHKWGLEPTETCNSSLKVAVLHAQKPQGESRNQYSLFIVVLITLLCVLKTTDEVWVPYRLVSLVLKSLFCTHKTTDEGWKPYRLDILVQITAVLHAQTDKSCLGLIGHLLFSSRSRCFACKNNRWGLAPTETCNSRPKVAVLHAQNHRRGLESI